MQPVAPQRLRALAVTPEERGPAETGDRVVIRALLAWLGERYELRPLAFPRVEGFRKRANVLLHLLPPEMAPHWRKGRREALAASLSSEPADLVFILHEGLFYLSDAVEDRVKTPVTLFAHNMLSRFERASPFYFATGALARRYERRWYARPGDRLVLISRGDRTDAADRGLVEIDAPVAPPGAPAASPLFEDAVFSGEAVVTGTFDWWRKRRDLVSFAAVGATLDLTAFDRRIIEAVPGARLAASTGDVDWSSAIRVGVITDRFAGGFKLKSLEYVARNCVVFSRAPIFEEFAGLPHAREFIIDDLDGERWPQRIEAFQRSPQAHLRERFLRFKSACLERYDWRTCLEPLTAIEARE